MKREIKEEVGIEVKDDMHLIFNDAFRRVSGHHFIAITFLCFWKSGEARALEHQEEVQWLTLKELQESKDMPDYMKTRIDALAEYLEEHEGE